MKPRKGVKKVKPRFSKKALRRTVIAVGTAAALTASGVAVKELVRKRAAREKARIERIVSRQEHLKPEQKKIFSLAVKNAESLLKEQTKVPYELNWMILRKNGELVLKRVPSALRETIKPLSILAKGKANKAQIRAVRDFTAFRMRAMNWDKTQPRLYKFFLQQFERLLKNQMSEAERKEFVKVIERNILSFWQREKGFKPPKNVVAALHLHPDGSSFSVQDSIASFGGRLFILRLDPKKRGFALEEMNKGKKTVLGFFESRKAIELFEKHFKPPKMELVSRRDGGVTLRFSDERGISSIRVLVKRNGKTEWFPIDFNGKKFGLGKQREIFLPSLNGVFLLIDTQGNFSEFAVQNGKIIAPKMFSK
jgi:hypothetical protein